MIDLLQDQNKGAKKKVGYNVGYINAKSAQITADLRAF
jgi:hypothetical protein